MREPVYRLVPGYENNLENILSMMDHDGPIPMKNLKPVKKQRTGAEKFQVEHHGQYDDRVPRSRDKVNQVHGHNKAYPDMYDELDKRRSLANPTALTVNKKPESKRMCRCHKYSRAKYTSRKSEFRKRNGRSLRNSVISKSRPRRFNLVKRYLKIAEMVDKGCQYKACHLFLDKGTVSICKDNKLSEQDENGAKVILFKTESGHQQSKTSVDNDIKTDIDSQNPDTTASLSSYHSYFSLDHEPMVQE